MKFYPQFHLYDHSNTTFYDMKIELDTEKLQPNRRDKSRFLCPACAEAGRDKQCNHLKVTPEWWGCCVDQSREHTRRIIELAGITIDRPANPLELARRRAKDERRRVEEKQANARRRQRARCALTEIVKEYTWHPADVWESSPTRLENDYALDARLFIQQMFSPLRGL